MKAVVVLLPGICVRARRIGNGPRLIAINLVARTGFEPVYQP